MARPPDAPDDRERLLLLLHADRSRSAARLELLERRLVCFFRWERAADPEARASAVLRQMTKLLAEGVEMLDPEASALELARTEPLSLRREAPARLEASPEAVSEWYSGLPESDRRLLERWFPFESALREASRAELAGGSHGVYDSLERALRLRERCVDIVR